MKQPRRKPVVCLPGQGRAYRLPTMLATFQADDAEAGDAYSISEWRLEPNSEGPGAHSQEAVKWYEDNT